MLNADMERYIEALYGNENSKARNNAILSLKAMHRYEYEWGCDFTLQPYAVLQDAFDEISGSNLGYATMKLAELVAYADWRKRNNLPCGEGIYSVHTDVVLSVRNEMVSSPDHLEVLLDTVFDSPEKASFDVIYRTFLWLGYSGLTDDEAICIKKDDIDFARYEIRYNGKVYQMYRESFNAISMACLSNSFYESDRSGNDKTKKLFPRQQGECILRGKANKRQVSTEQLLSNTLRPNLAKKIKSAMPRIVDSDTCLPQKFSYRKIYLSGIFYRTFLNEQLGEQPNFSTFIIDEIQKRKTAGRAYKTNETFTETSIINRTNKKYLENYENWKRAFHDNSISHSRSEYELTYEQAVSRYETSIEKARILSREAQNTVDKINDLGESDDYAGARKKFMEARAEHRKARKAHSKMMEMEDEQKD